MNYFDRLFFAQYLREWEELLFVCHKHIIMIIDDVLLLLFFGLLVPGFLYFHDSFALRSLIPFFYAELYVFVLYLYTFYKIFDWYNDVWLVTDLGLIDIDWNIYTRSIEYVEFSDIKAAEIETASWFDSLFGKGDIVVKVHGGDDGFVLEGAENPYEMVSYINEVIEEAHHGHHEEDEKEPLDLLLHTLTEVVREHLQKGGRSEWEEWAGPEVVEKVLKKKGTIDLR